MNEPFLDRFWSKVAVRGPDECWPWLAGQGDGYGSFRLTRADGPSRSMPAHVVAYETSTGEQRPPGSSHDLHHTCENRLCQNPRHLIVLAKSEHGRQSSFKRWRQEGS